MLSFRDGKLEEVRANPRDPDPRHACLVLHALAIIWTVSEILCQLASFAADWPRCTSWRNSAVKIELVAPGVYLGDFGRVAFGNLPARSADKRGVLKTHRSSHFGEDFKDGRINRKPPAPSATPMSKPRSARTSPQVVAPKPDARNTHQPEAVLTPPEFGVLIPFRWVEIEGWPGELRANDIKRRAAFAKNWNDDAASFHSSDELLNHIWDLCRYSIKATTFAGVYVDGDRERIAYEGDAYLNQLSHYYAEGDIEMARATFDRLMKFPTWPTEWASRMIFIAHADWMQTGDTAWLAPRYEALKKKLHLKNAREDGLIVTPEKKLKDDLVDWPIGRTRRLRLHAGEYRGQCLPPPRA